MSEKKDIVYIVCFQTADTERSEIIPLEAFSTKKQAKKFIESRCSEGKWVKGIYYPKNKPYWYIIEPMFVI